MENEELLHLVRRGLAELPAQQAEAFWLRHLEGLSPAEVAEQMGIEAGARATCWSIVPPWGCVTI